MRLINSRTATIAVAGVLLVGVGAGGATAAQMIDGSDIKAGTIGIGKLKPGLVDRINQTGAQGPTGSRGPQGPAGPQGPKGDSNVAVVKNLSGDWTTTTSGGVKMTGDGVQFGPFADGGSCEANTGYGQLNFSGLNGKKLSDLTNLAYTGWYVADTDTGGVGSPTMRVFFSGTDSDGVANRLTFSPNTQFNKPFNYDDAQGTVHEWLVTHGTVRYNDDGDDMPAGEKAWSTWVAQFPNATITRINILNGCQNGTNLTSVIREVQANGTHYEFGAN